MYFLDSLLSATSLAMDAFAVSICIGAGIRGAWLQTALRMGGTCGLFQFVMPMLGWFAGVYTVNFMAAFDHWVAFGLLALVGGNMIRGALGPDDGCRSEDPTKSIALLYLSLATSIDALAVGASFALTDRPVLPLALCAGVITLALCFIGVRFGRQMGEKLGKKVELIGGLVLILIGLGILREHLS
ncbi:MAG: manganese efflux pump MntP family protein [Synergistaceae bacterium]|jgi:putative Mn2+ efflux pump MntP|nr:manganese efflux pump MntP family protein [Synergistaceae bacterium]